MTPKKRAEYMVQSIFQQQHVDDRTIMICLSTTKIALWMCDMFIHCDYGTQEQRDYWIAVKEELEKI